MVLQPAVVVLGRVRGNCRQELWRTIVRPLLSIGARRNSSRLMYAAWYNTCCTNFTPPHLTVPGLNKLVSDIAFYFGNIFFDLLFFFFFADEQYLFGINDDTIIQPL